jgi:hypothetical protein
VNHVASESRLASLKPEDVVTRFPNAKTRVVAVADDVTPLVSDLHGGRDLWRLLLVLAAVFLVAESLIGWRVSSQSMG